MVFDIQKFKQDFESNKALKGAQHIDLTETRQAKLFVSTQIPAIDWAFGKGLPIGKIAEITGDFSSGKSLIATHVLAETIKQGGFAVLLENETSMELQFCENVGLDYTKLSHWYPKTLQEGYQILFSTLDILEAATARDVAAKALFDKAAKKKKADGEEEAVYIPEAPPFTVIVWDSISAAPTVELKRDEAGRVDVEFSMKDRLGAAVIHSNLLPHLVNRLENNNVLFIPLSQLRDKVGVMYGATEETMGGRGLKFFAHIRAIFKKGQKIAAPDGEVIGRTGTMEVIKNKCAPPFRKVDLNILFDRGFDFTSGFKDLVLKLGLVTREKNSYYYTGKAVDVCQPGWQIAGSKAEFDTAIQENTEGILDALTQDILQA